MVSIEIDDELYAYLSKQAIAFVDKTPNDVLKRLLKIHKTPVQTPKSSNSLIRKKSPKTNISYLMNAGLLVDGQNLFLSDYQGNRIKNISAKVNNGLLHYNGKGYSMSDLARILLKNNGFQSDSVRGPLFWYTESGKSVKELWDIYLRNHYK
jgi:hypothetical protein